MSEIYIGCLIVDVKQAIEKENNIKYFDEKTGFFDNIGILFILILQFLLNDV